MPVWAAIAVAIKWDDGGPVFYRQRRIGRNGREFVSLKFRSMIFDSDKKWGATPAMENDPRITRIGRFLRATAMDELPQLWNILRGEMSFVGPRPEWVELARKFEHEVPGFGRRHVVRPGLTGFAQVYGNSDLPRRNKLRYDLLYIKNSSLWIDLRLIAVSFLVTFAGQWEKRSSRISGRWMRRPSSQPRVMGGKPPVVKQSLSVVEEKPQ